MLGLGLLILILRSIDHNLSAKSGGSYRHLIRLGQGKGRGVIHIREEAAFTVSALQKVKVRQVMRDTVPLRRVSVWAL